MNVERAIWMILVAAAAFVAHVKTRSQSTVEAARPAALSPEVQAYIDRKLEACAKSAAGAKAPAAEDGLRELTGKIAALEQTSQLRSAALAKCPEIPKEVAKVFDEQASVNQIMRERELNRLRARTAANCAGATFTNAAPTKRATLK